MLLDLAKEKKILFFGGKGGVGKTTVSATTALAMAESGKKVLLVSTDPAHNLGHLFNRELGPSPTLLSPNLDAIELDPQQTIDVHLKEVATALRRLMPVQMADEVDKHMELSREAPGMEEAAMLERIAEVVEQADRQYELVVFDTAPSGHTARLMALPEMMSAWTEGLLKRRDKSDKLNKILQNLGNDKSQGDGIFGQRSELDSTSDKNSTTQDSLSSGDREERIRTLLNRRRQRFADLRDALVDENRTSFIIVLAAERLPVLESIELYQRLRKTGVSIGAMVINKRLPKDDIPFLNERRAQEQQHLDTLHQALPNVVKHDIELAAHDVVGLDALKLFTKCL